MQQLLLDVFTPPTPSLGNFLPGSNAQVLHTLQALALPKGTARGQDTQSQRFVYLYGPAGCGKSHLLQALATALGVPVRRGAERFVFKPSAAPLLMDNIQALSPYSQVQLFNAYNHMLEPTGQQPTATALQQPAFMVLASPHHPSDLALREDLRTRIAAGLCLPIQPLSDDEKAIALQNMAQMRGLTLSSEVVDYALRHFQRDMGSLMAVMDGLDRFSLEQHKPVSVHLLREWMKRREGLVVRA